LFHSRGHRGLYYGGVQLKPILFFALLASFALAGCTVTPATIAAGVKEFCATYGAAAPTLQALLAANGAIIGISSNEAAEIAAGAQLVTINCAALTAAVAKSPTPLAPEAVLKAAHVDPVVVAKALRQYK
jgi:hypothetical protein